jgi:hypothetical protein
MIFFVDKFWPDFNIFDLMKIILRYNNYFSTHQKLLKQLKEKVNNSQENGKKIK